MVHEKVAGDSKGKAKQAPSEGLGAACPLYDITIVGAGIGGLYLGLYLKSLQPNRRIAVIERDSRVGGRVLSGNYRDTAYELGAGRISSANEYALQLIRHYQLPLKPISNDFSYHDPERDPMSFVEIMTLVTPIIAKLRVASLFYRTRELYQTTILEMARRHLGRDQAKLLEQYFPYYSEIAVENAFEGFAAIEAFSPLHTFYVLECGLSELTDKIALDFERLGGELIINCELQDVKVLKNDKIQVKCQTQNRHIELITNQLVCTNDIDSLIKIPYFRSRIGHTVREYGIGTQPLLRIYAAYPLDGNGHVWFDGLGRVATSLPIRLIIPISPETGLVMISYTDGKYAEWWWPLVKQFDRRPKQLIEAIQSQLDQLFPHLEIPDPLWMEPCYWQHGGNFNRPNEKGLAVGQVSDNIHSRLDNNIYIANQALSHQKNWLEGSLDVVRRAILFVLSS